MHNRGITWLRAIACIMVVIIHLVGAWPYNPQRSFFSLFNSIIRGGSLIAVPLFAMISGFLLFGRDEKPSANLGLKRFLAIFVPIAYFGTIYYLYDIFSGQASYPYLSIFIENKESSHQLWYLFAILPIYTLSAYLHLPQNRSRLFYGGFLAFIGFLFFITESIKFDPFSITTKYFLNYLLLFMLAGFALGKISFKTKASIFLGAYLLFSFLIIIFRWLQGGNYRNYSNIFLFLQSLSFFAGILALNIEKITESPLGRLLDNSFSFIAKYSLGIYGWHAMLIPNIKNWGESLGLPGRYNLAFTLFSTLLFSLLIAITDTWLWARIRKGLAPLWNWLCAKLPLPRGLQNELK